MEVGQIAHHPVAQIRRAAQPASASASQTGGSARRVGHEQRKKRYSNASPNKVRTPDLSASAITSVSKPTLPDARRALDDQDAPMALDQPCQQRADHLQLARPPPNRRSHEPLAADIKSAG
jgi:hypothetical protein